MNVEDCSEEQKKLVAELKSRHDELVQSDPVYYSDSFFVRWLVARAWNVDDAHSMLEISKQWRADNKIDSLVDEYGAAGNETRELLERFCPMGMYGVDKRGCPVYIERLGSFDIKGLLAAIKMEDLERHHIFQLERAEREKCKAGVAKDGKPFLKHYVIEDLSGLGWSHVSSVTMDLTKKLVAIDEAHYPESAQKLFIINAPWIFNTVWKMLKPMLADRTVAKIEICGSSFLPTLTEVIDAEQLPKDFGGTCEQPLAAGGIVPESYYRGHDVSGDADVVHEAIVNRSSTHEVRVPVNKDDLLAYEFWTDGYDIGFSVAFCAKGHDTERVPVLPSSKVDSHVAHVHGDVTATDDGSFILIFDNAHSMFRKKQLYYKLSVPTGAEQPQVTETDVEA